ncbi:peroxin-2 [Angomonas deanei]|nr:peroxin-2 [Angomonas deanei]|eukprot:EPY42580.1 peroxin-2 [Angomonas deanei]
MTSVTSIHPLLAPKRTLLLVHFVFTIIVPYLLRKLRRKSMEENWEQDESSPTRRRTALVLKYAVIVWACLSLANTLHFLATGKYRSLVERVLSLRPVYGSQQMRRFTNLIYMNQHVWWTTWMSLFSVLKVGRYFRRILSTVRTITTSGSQPTNTNVCCACREMPTIAQKSNCGHTYCYYCIKSRLLDSQATGSFRCCRCTQAVHSCFPA